MNATIPSSSDPLLQPFRLKNLVFKNRVMSTSHAAGIDEAGTPGERYQLYHEEKAKGGIALTMFGGSSMVSQDSNWGGGQIDLTSDRIIPSLQTFADRIHQHDSLLMCQISHLGRRADSMVGSWLPTISASPLREFRHRNFPREMDQHDIDRVIRDFCDAARRAKEGGLDGIETMTSAHLIGQFLSPAMNQRTDRYGGSTENRMRFLLMVHEAIRKAVGDDFVVGIRYGIDEGDPKGLDFEESTKIAQLIEREGTVDFFNARYGRQDMDIYLVEHSMPNMSQPSAPHLRLVGEFKKLVGLPVFHACRIQDVATARYAIAEGLVDMVGMTRAHIADPHIVNKIVEGREDEIRPCVGAAFCQFKKITCIHNPATSRERSIPQIVPKSAGPGKKVLVIGGGVAGLEAARVSAERGHQVVLVEASGELGGQVNIASRASWRRDLRGIVDWRVSEIARLGVELKFNTFVDVEDIDAFGAEIVVYACGGVPDYSWLKGAEHCSSVWDVLCNPEAVSDHVLIWDGTGRHDAPSTAVHLSRRGHKVDYVTADQSPFLEMPYPDRAIFSKQFAELDIDLTVNLGIDEVASQNASVEIFFNNLLTGKRTSRQAGQAIIAYGTVANDELYHAIKQYSTNEGYLDIGSLTDGTPQGTTFNQFGKYQLFRIGDASASRNIHGAIYEATRLCMTF